MTPPFTGGNHALARADWDTGPCDRCGIIRPIHPQRPTTCKDCRAQQAADDAAWLRFHPVPAMSAEDRAWCLQQEERGFWLRWEQLNRRDETTESTVDKALTISRRYPMPPSNQPLQQSTSHREAG